MEKDEKKKYLLRTKERLYKLGFRCMTRAAFVILAMFILCREPDGGIRYFPEPLFWGIQIFITVIFVGGAIGYIVSLTIHTEDEDEE